MEGGRGVCGGGGWKGVEMMGKWRVEGEVNQYDPGRQESVHTAACHTPLRICR